IDKALVAARGATGPAGSERADPLSTLDNIGSADPPRLSLNVERSESPFTSAAAGELDRRRVALCRPQRADASRLREGTKRLCAKSRSSERTDVRARGEGKRAGESSNTMLHPPLRQALRSGHGRFCARAVRSSTALQLRKTSTRQTA